MRRIGKTFVEGARRGLLAGRYALITFYGQLFVDRMLAGCFGRGLGESKCVGLSPPWERFEDLHMLVVRARMIHYAGCWSAMLDPEICGLRDCLERWH